MSALTLDNASRLAGFAVKMAPEFYRRVSADLQRKLLPAPHRPDFSQWTDQGLRAAWIGHSTVVLSLGGFIVITDPVFSARVGINVGPVTLGIKRLVEPAAALVAIPRPDLILLSHAHMDHFDIPSLRSLENSRTTVITAAKTSDLLRPRRYQAVHELAWNQTARVGPATVRAFEVNHWGARMQSDTQRGYNGYVLEANGFRVLFGGDTAITSSFRQLRSARTHDLAIMPIGAYDPWIRMHCNPEQALAMADDAGADAILPVHHLTFELSREPRGEPISRFLAAAADRVQVRDIGQEFHLTARRSGY